MAFPREAMDVSAVYDCGISCSYSLFFFTEYYKPARNSNNKVGTGRITVLADSPNPIQVDDVDVPFARNVYAVGSVCNRYWGS